MMLILFIYIDCIINIILVQSSSIFRNMAFDFRACIVYVLLFLNNNFYISY